MLGVDGLVSEIQLHIEATDRAGNSVRSDMYSIEIKANVERIAIMLMVVFAVMSAIFVYLNRSIGGCIICPSLTPRNEPFFKNWLYFFIRGEDGEEIHDWVPREGLSQEA